MSTALNASLIKALEILELFSAEETEVSAKTVAESLHMSTATAHRFLLTLEHTGYLVSPRRGQFTLGEKLEELGKLAFEINPLPSLARPVVEALSRDLNESTMACRLGRRGPVCVASANSRRAIRISVDIGAELPLTVTAQGKLFLAYMDRDERLTYAKSDVERLGCAFDADRATKLEASIATVLEQGYATNFGENETEMAAIAAPVFDADGRTILTLSVFGIMSRFDDALIERATSQILESAATLQTRLRDRGPDRLLKHSRRMG